MKTNNFIKRVLLLTNIFSPYRIIFLNCLAREKGIDLKVCYLAEQEKNRKWKTYNSEVIYKSEILSGFHFSMAYRTIHINWGIKKTIEEFRPHAVVIGTDILSSPVSWLALSTARRCGSKVIRFEGQHLFSATPTSLKNLLYMTFYKRCHAFFVYSHLAKEYLQVYGIEGNKITVGYNVGDTEYFLSSVREFENSPKYLIERQKCPEVMFLFSGVLSQRKNILGLLNAFKTIDLKDAGLFILGDGELKNQVVQFAKNNPALNIFYEGFIQKDEIIEYFALADIFVLPTLRDPASIVLSEALFSGLYTISSVYDGSSGNFIKEGINGTIIDPRNQSQLQKALLKAYELKKSGKINKHKIRETMSDYTVDHYSQRLAQLVHEL